MGSLVTTPISTLFNLNVVQVEVSSKCTLKCSRCPRTELDLPYLNQEISLVDFKRIFTPEVLLQIEYLLFCGHTGDPIYATEFLEIIEYIKTNANTKLQIVTNGSFKKSIWWEQLGLLLDMHDSVTFSIDGWDNTSNNLYRTNSSWDSIITGITTLRSASPCYINWSTIYFKFNQDEIDKIANIAKELGCDSFQLVKSAKFDNTYIVNGTDPLKPSKEEFVSQDNNYKRSKIIFKRENPFTIEQTRNVHPWAKCLNCAKEINVTVTQDVYPCGWFNTGYQENPFVSNFKDRLSVKNKSLKDVLEDSVWGDLVDSFQSNVLPICKIKCYVPK